MTDGAKPGKKTKEEEKLVKREKVEIRRPTEEEEFDRKERERKAKTELLEEKKKLGGVDFQGNELGPSKRENMLRMGNIGSSSNHAVVMEELGMIALFNDGAGDREEDELAEGAVGGLDGVDTTKSGKLFTNVIDDVLYTYSSATSHQLKHMTDTLNVTLKRLQDSGKLGEDKSSKKAVAKKIAKINRISQQAILKALSLDG